LIKTSVLALSALAQISLGHASSSVISASFSGGGGSGANTGGGPYEYNIAPATSLGVVPSERWNNLAASSGSDLILHNARGDASARITYQANGYSGSNINWNLGTPTASITNPIQGLFNTFLNYFWSDAGSAVTVSNLGSDYTAHGYSVIVYFSNPDTAAKQRYSVTSGSVTDTRWAYTNSGTAVSGFVQSTATTAAAATSPANYVTLSGFSGSSFTLTSGDYSTLAGKRAAIAGFQIVPNPSPAISINFSGGGSTGTNSAGGPYQYDIPATTQAGVVPSRYWNNLVNSSGTSVALQDNSGTTSAASITYAANGSSGSNINWNMGTPTGSITDPDKGLLNTFLNYFWQDGGGSITVSGLGSKYTTDGYSVIVYFANPDANATQYYSATDGSTTVGRWARTNTSTVLDGFVESSGETQSTATTGNYVTLRGLTGSSFTLTGSTYSTVNGTRPAIAGLQIVAESPIYVYTLKEPLHKLDGNGQPIIVNNYPERELYQSVRAFDEATAVTSLQGVINRTSTKLYILPHATNDHYNHGQNISQYWFNKISANGQWLKGRRVILLSDFTDVIALAKENGLQGSVIWDEYVPATYNVALTAAGVENLAVFSPYYLSLYGSALPARRDLRGEFDGTNDVNYNGITFATTGSAKNDAYQWAIKMYLDTGKVSSQRAFRSIDPWHSRAGGMTDYANTCDWAVSEKAFVFDLSLWSNEKPADDPNQTMGLDYATHVSIMQKLMNLANGQHLTEIVGWFDYVKYTDEYDSTRMPQHDPYLTEQQKNWLVSQYNCYGNGIPNGCLNQSFHRLAPRTQLSQQSAERKTAAQSISYSPTKIYVAVLMGDFDSSGWLYTQLPRMWEDTGRGSVPLSWCINPNLVEAYPDLIRHVYATATANDMFVTSANCAGYLSPTKLPVASIPLFTEHNIRFFEETDMTIAPMVTDITEPSEALKDSFAQFATEGYGALIWDPVNYMNGNSVAPTPQVHDGMVIFNVRNETSDPAFASATEFCSDMANTISGAPGFYCFRTSFLLPSDVATAVTALQTQNPTWDIEVVDMHAFLAAYKKALTP
jgi:hypothetical protein